MKREFLLSLMEDLPKDVVDAIMEENGRDIQTARQAAQEWESKYNQAVQDHTRELNQVQFDARLRAQIAQAGGRNHKAIAALMDLESLQGSDSQEAAIADAVKAVKKECGYLFLTPQPPLYAVGTGTAAAEPAEPETLAGALREKFERK